MASWPTKELDLQLAAQLNASFAKKKAQDKSFITITREYGCDAKPLAAWLQNTLNQDNSGHLWEVYHKDDFLRACEQGELQQEMINILDEYGHSEFQGYIQEAIFGQKNQYEVIRRLGKVERMLARRGHVILVGAGSSALTQDMEGGLHLRVYADEAWRSNNYAKKHGISQTEAAALVQEHQGRRSAWSKTYLAEPINDTSLYDVMFNNERLSAAAMGGVVITILNSK